MTALPQTLGLAFVLLFHGSLTLAFNGETTNTQNFSVADHERLYAAPAQRCVLKDNRQTSTLHQIQKAIASIHANIEASHSVAEADKETLMSHFETQQMELQCLSNLFLKAGLFDLGQTVNNSYQSGITAITALSTGSVESRNRRLGALDRQKRSADRLAKDMASLHQRYGQLQKSLRNIPQDAALTFRLKNGARDKDGHLYSMRELMVLPSSDQQAIKDLLDATTAHVANVDQLCASQSWFKDDFCH